MNVGTMMFNGIVIDEPAGKVFKNVRLFGLVPILQIFSIIYWCSNIEVLSLCLPLLLMKLVNNVNSMM